MQHLQKRREGMPWASHWSRNKVDKSRQRSQSYENTGGVGVFFPFWSSSRSVERRRSVALFAATMQVVHGDVQVNLSAGRLDANHQRFRVRAARQPRFVHVDFRRKHFKMKSLVVQ